MRAEFQSAFPKASWHEWEPITGDEERAGTEIAFGSRRSASIAMLDQGRRRGVPRCGPAVDACRRQSPFARLGFEASSRRFTDPAHQEMSRVYAVEGVLVGHRHERRRSGDGSQR